LKKLLETPNTIPMERWLTIGVPDPRAWQPAMGGQWTQHAGVISAEQVGDGFGGRSHCLSLTEVPELPYEVAVNVKLDDEEGAAGLIVACDEQQRCYGFYPTGGNLRLVRFDGPIPTTWTIFATVPHAAYRRGDFNHLRIRVEADTLTCFINGKEVIRQQDDSFRDGRAGLCKFRATQAEFKGFRIGPDLRDKPVPAEIATRVLDTVKGYLDQEHSRSEALDALLTDRAAARRVLTDRAQTLEKEAAALRKLSSELHRRSTARELVLMLTQPEDKIDLMRAALMIAKHDNAEVDVPHYLRLVDRMASELRNDAAIKKGGEAAVKRLNRYLFEENGFHGSRYDYDNAANSYLNEVLENREGLPITLSVVFIELARRLGLKDIVGMPLPGRFMVGYKAKGKDAPWRFNDVFNAGKLLSAEEAWTSLDLPADEVEPATKRLIIERMLNNLIGQLHDEQDLPKPESVPYLSLLIDLNPQVVSYRFQRFTARSKANDFEGARDDLRAILDDPPAGINEDQIRELHALFRRIDDRAKGVTR
jgi:serine protease Do